MFESMQSSDAEIVGLWVIGVDDVVGSAVYVVKFYSQECQLVSSLFVSLFYLDVVCKISLFRTFVILNEKRFFA